jgi:hypothetical protein
MGTNTATEDDRLTDRERQTSEHREQAQRLGVPLTEYKSAYDVDVLRGPQGAFLRLMTW